MINTYDILQKINSKYSTYFNNIDEIPQFIIEDILKTDNSNLVYKIINDMQKFGKYSFSGNALVFLNIILQYVDNVDIVDIDQNNLEHNYILLKVNLLDNTVDVVKKDDADILIGGNPDNFKYLKLIIFVTNLEKKYDFLKKTYEYVHFTNETILKIKAERKRQEEDAERVRRQKEAERKRQEEDAERVRRQKEDTERVRRQE
jgi:hypothetical protein